MLGIFTPDNIVDDIIDNIQKTAIKKGVRLPISWVTTNEYFKLHLDYTADTIAVDVEIHRRYKVVVYNYFNDTHDRRGAVVKGVEHISTNL